MDFEYFIILKFFFFCLIISIILFSLSFFLVYQQANLEKLSAYECGFNPFGDARYKFEVHYYLVGILFIIFDLEITFLLPWLFIVSKHMTLESGISMCFFILLLTVGFVYEFIKGALDWK